MPSLAIVFYIYIYFFFFETCILICLMFYFFRHDKFIQDGKQTHDPNWWVTDLFYRKLHVYLTICVATSVESNNFDFQRLIFPTLLRHENRHVFGKPPVNFYREGIYILCFLSQQAWQAIIQAEV